MRHIHNQEKVFRKQEEWGTLNGCVKPRGAEQCRIEERRACMTDRTLENTDDSVQHHNPHESNDPQEVIRVAPDMPGADPVRFPSKSGDEGAASHPTEIAEEVEQREYGLGDESSS